MRFPKRSVWLVAAWATATVATAAVALAVVGLAGEQVADPGVQPLSAHDVDVLGVQIPATLPTVASTGATTSTSSGVPSTLAEVTTSTITPTTTGSTAVPTTTEAPAASTTEAARIDSREITGGTVVVRWTSSSVELVSASPADGFHVDVEKRGPDQVVIEFEGSGVKSKYSAEIADGRLVVDTSVEEEGD